jgi:hypothetical protein
MNSCVVEEVETEVEEGVGDGFAVDGEILLFEMPTSRTNNRCRKYAVGAEFIFLFSLLEVDLSTDGVVEVDLAIDHVVLCWCARICSYISLVYSYCLAEAEHTFKIRYINLNIRVQGIDNHLPIRKTNNLHFSINQIWSRWGSLPRIILSNILYLWKELWQRPLIQLHLSDYTSLQKLLSCPIERSM